MPHQAPVSPSLPQNDTPAQQAARAAQLALTQQQYQWTTAVPSLPGAPVVAQLPANEQPTLTWWVLLGEIFITLVRNHLAVKLAAVEQGLLPLAPAAIAADSLAVDAIEAVGLLVQIEDRTIQTPYGDRSGVVIARAS